MHIAIKDIREITNITLSHKRFTPTSTHTHLNDLHRIASRLKYIWPLCHQT